MAARIKKETDRLENYWQQVRKAEKKHMPIPPKPPDTEPEFSPTLKPMKKQKGIKFFARWKLSRKPETTYLVTMRFSNGTQRTWVINAKEEVFRYRARTYYLRYEDSVYNITHKQQELFYHEDHVTPIQKEIIRMEDPDAEPGSETARAYFSVVPSNVRDLLKQEYVKVLAQAQELSKYLKAGVVLSVFILLILLGVLYMNLRASGAI